MKTSLILLVLLAISILAAVSNPNEARHKEVIKTKVKQHLQKSMNDNPEETNKGLELAGLALGMMLGGMVVDQMVENLITTDNYVVFSATKINWDGESKLIGIGAFGQVFVTGKLDEALQQELLKN